MRRSVLLVSYLLLAQANAIAAEWFRLGLEGHSIYIVEAYPGSPDVLFAGGGPEVQGLGEQAGEGMFRSDDGGATWTPVNSGLPGIHRVNTISFDAASPEPHPIFIGVLRIEEPGGFGPNLFRSTDLGESWQAVTDDALQSAVSEVSAIAFDPLQPGTGYVSLNGFPGGIARTDDGGDSWAVASSGLTGGLCADGCVVDLVLDPTLPTTLYAAVPDFPDVFKSEDGAASWAPTGATLWPERLALPLAQPMTVFATGTVPGVGGVEKTVDGGALWVDLTDKPGLPQPSDDASHRALAVDPGDPDSVWVVVESGIFEGEPFEAVYHSRDGGLSWEIANSGLEGVRVYGLSFRGETLLAATDDGIYEYAEGTAAPSMLTAEPLAPDQIRLSWVDNSDDETAFLLEARTQATAFEEVASVPANTQSTVLTDLEPGTTYTFRVRARRPAGPSSYSNEATATTPALVPCGADPNILCLRGRFGVSARWSLQADSGDSGALAKPTPLTEDTGAFWFFSPNNIELVVKVLDGCSQPGRRYWVFAAGLTDVGVEITVTDTQADLSKSYRNPLGERFQPVLDTAAFATCP